jgi:signal transduction histidine kinase
VVGSANRVVSLAPTENAIFRYGLPVVVVAVAYALQRLIWPFIPASPHLLFYPAVFVSARFGGRASGYLATALAAAGIAYGFLPPEGVFVVEKTSDVLDLGIFASVGCGISAGIGQLRAALARESAAAARATEAKKSTDATWSMVAHDLRMPLHVITLGSGQLGRRASTPMPPEMEKTLGMIRRSTERARGLLDDALDAMAATEGKLAIEPAECDARELCEHAIDAVSLLAQRQGVKLECDVATRETLLCDQARVEQVLTNLLGNAIKVTPRHGVVSLYVDASEGGLELSIHHAGVEIPDSELWIACAILEAHATALAVDTCDGEGTTFRFTLPRVST